MSLDVLPTQRPDAFGDRRDPYADQSLSFTTVVAVDDQHANELEIVWPTWKQFRPELLEHPLLLICDADRSEREWERRLDFLDHPNRRLASWTMEEATQREKMLSSLILVTSQLVETEWYLNLDTDVVATGPAPWVDPAWFAPREGALPAFVAPGLPYGFAAARFEPLERWGDEAPIFAGHPRLDLAARIRRGRLRGGRFVGWALFGNTAFTRRVAACCCSRLPVPSQDLVLWYAAERAGLPWRGVDMSQIGFAHCPPRRLKARCRRILSATKLKPERPSPVAVAVRSTLSRPLLPLPPMLSQRGPIPRTLVVAAIGDRGKGVHTWLDRTASAASEELRSFVVYSGQNRESPFAAWLRRTADRYLATPGDKFEHLANLAAQEPQVLNEFDYVLLIDDDVALEPETLERLVRTAHEFGLRVAAPSIEQSGIARWPHMIRRGSATRSGEPAAGVELCNYVRTKCILLATEIVPTFLDSRRRFGDRMDPSDSEWLLANSCYTDSCPFGALHNIGISTVRSSWPRPKGGGERADRIEELRFAERAKLAGGGRLQVAHPSEIRAWLPSPRLRCINLERAPERRERFSREWIDGLRLPVRFFAAFDRRDVEAGDLYFPYDERAARKRIGRGLTSGEIACATSHALAMREEQEFCGPEGVFIFEDDCFARPGAENMAQRIVAAREALPGLEAVICHEPLVQWTAADRGGGAVRLRKPPWGTVAAWYSPEGLRRAGELIAKLEAPADWTWAPLARAGVLGMLDPGICWHERAHTTYVGNQHRRSKRRFVP